MTTLLFGIAVLAIALWALNGFTRVKSADRGDRAARPVAGSARSRSPVFSAFAAGSISPSRSAASGWRCSDGCPGAFRSLGARTQKGAGQVSSVRSAFVEMELDHDSGAMRGRFSTGPHDGIASRRLDVATLIGLPRRRRRGKSRTTYGVSRPPGSPVGVKTLQDGAAAGQRQRAVERRQNDGSRRPIRSLACKRGRAPRTSDGPIASLMKKLHPDQGGSTYLAARVNEAKDVLLRRHR